MSIYSVLTDLKQLENLIWIDHLIFILNYPVLYGELLYIYDQIALQGNLPLLKKFLSSPKTKIRLLPSLASSAAKNGHLDLLIFLIKEGIKFDDSVYDRACESGFIDILKWLDRNTYVLEKHQTTKNTKTPAVIAAKKGHLNIIKYLDEQKTSEKAEINSRNFWSIITAAGSEGYINIIKWVFEKYGKYAGIRALTALKYKKNIINLELIGFKGFMEIIEYLIMSVVDVERRVLGSILIGAIKGGQYKIIEYLLNNGIKPGKTALLAAIKSNNINIVKLLYQKLIQLDFPELRSYIENKDECNLAAENENIVLLKYFHSQQLNHIRPYFKWGRTTMSIAAKKGNLDMVKYLYENNCPHDEDTYEKAAGSGNMDLINYLDKNKFSFNTGTFSAAVESGNMDIVLFIEKKFSANLKNIIDFCSIAASNNDLNMLKYLADNNFSLSEYAFYHSIENENTEMIIYLHKMKCPWNASTTTSAAVQGNLEILKYLHENGCPWDERCVKHAAINNDLDMLEYLYKEKCPLGVIALEAAAEKGSIDAVIFLLKKNYTCNDESCHKAVENNNLEIFKYLRKHGCPCDKGTLNKIREKIGYIEK